jgi:hypothetical protein
MTISDLPSQDHADHQQLRLILAALQDGVILIEPRGPQCRVQCLARCDRNCTDRVSAPPTRMPFASYVANLTTPRRIVSMGAGHGHLDPH